MKTFPIIEKLGGRAAVAEQLSSDDRSVTRDAIRMWSARGRIPGHAVKRMLAVAEEQGIEIVASDLEIDPSINQEKAS